MVVETIIATVYTRAKVIKFGALVSKGIVSKTCLLKGSGRKICERHFQHELAKGSVHIRTEHSKEIAHRVGRELFTGDTPVGERLKEFKESPSYMLQKGVDKDEVFNFPENLEVILKRIKEVGPDEFFKHILDAGIHLML